MADEAGDAPDEGVRREPDGAASDGAEREPGQGDDAAGGDDEPRQPDTDTMDADTSDAAGEGAGESARTPSADEPGATTDGLPDDGDAGADAADDEAAGERRDERGEDAATDGTDDRPADDAGGAAASEPAPDAGDAPAAGQDPDGDSNGGSDDGPDDESDDGEQLGAARGMAERRAAGELAEPHTAEYTPPPGEGTPPSDVEAAEPNATDEGASDADAADADADDADADDVDDGDGEASTVPDDWSPEPAGPAEQSEHGGPAHRERPPSRDDVDRGADPRAPAAEDAAPGADTGAPATPPDAAAPAETAAAGAPGDGDGGPGGTATAAGAGAGGGGGGVSGEAGGSLLSGPESDQEMPLADHIEEMIKRLGIVVLVAAIVSAIVLPLGDSIITFLWNSVLTGTDARPHLYSPPELIITQVKVASLAGLILALPVLVYESYLFMRPGLYPHERRYYLAAVPTSLVLAFVGLVFAYFVVLPAVFTYFLEYSEDTAVIAFGLEPTFNLILVLLGYLALVFQIPLFVMLAMMMGLVTRRWLIQRRLLFWGAFAGISFFFSPDPTGVSPLIIAATMIVLFEGTLFLSRWTKTGQRT